MSFYCFLNIIKKPRVVETNGADLFKTSLNILMRLQRYLQYNYGDINL